MDEEFKEIQTLLRLKKYEQPSQGFESYSERFLKEFHRRQRWESSQKTGVAYFAEKIGEWMNLLTVPRYAYVTTLAIFAAIALAINGYQPLTPSTNLASIVPTESIVPQVSAPVSLALNSPLDLSELEGPTNLRTAAKVVNAEIQPRYILDVRPASYDQPFSF